MKRKAIIFDRDGTLIVDKIYLNDPGQIEYLPGVFDALRLLRDDGFVFAVATNQSGVARGIVDVKNLDEIHRIIQADFCRYGVDILSFHSAPYMTDFDHPFRKPNPGMLLEAVRWHDLDSKRSWMIGDRDTDIVAGQRAGMRTGLLSAQMHWEKPEPAPDIMTVDMLDMAKTIVGFDKK